MNFRKFLTACCLSVCALQFSAPQAQAGIHLDVNVGIGAPGYYGILPIQGVMPQVWNSSPVIAVGAAIPGVGPIYLTVPLEHRKHWGQYCGRYDACARPVYFVKRPWYDKHYVKHNRPHHRPHFDRDDDHHKHDFHKHEKHGHKKWKGHHKHDDD